MPGVDRDTAVAGEVLPSASAEEFVLTDAVVVTADAAMPRARSLHVRGGRIVSVSTSSTPASSRSRDLPRMACGGRIVVPGFVDAHAHVFAWGERLLTLDLGASSSIAEIRRAIHEQVLAHPQPGWIRARGYDEFRLREKRHPDRRDLDAVAPMHPVRLTHRSGHAHVLNSVALALAGITRDSADPPGGIIERELASGEPTGVLFGMHQTVARVVPALSPREADRAIAHASDSLVSKGITTVHDTSPRNDLRRLEAYRGWRRRGLLRPRLRMAIGWEAFDALDVGQAQEIVADECVGQAQEMPTDECVGLAGVKVIVHQTTGSLDPPQSRLDALIERIHRSGWQAIVHAIEPAAIAAACAAIERAVALAPRDHRHRIEHCSVCPPALARRIAAAGITVVTHPSFVHFNGARYLATVPEEEQNDLYPLATLLAAGVAVAAASDLPVVPPDPLVGMHAAMTRCTADGRLLGSAQAITPAAALAMHTIDAARAMRLEGDRGALHPGALADFVVLDGDPLRMPARADDRVTVHSTWIGGQCVYERNQKQCSGSKGKSE